MREQSEILEAFGRLRRDTLEVWIARGWISPERGRNGYRFREIDVARIRLIEELGLDLALGEDAVDVILPLIDQIHDLRRRLRLLARAIEAEPEEVRRRLAKAIAEGLE